MDRREYMPFPSEHVHRDHSLIEMNQMNGDRQGLCRKSQKGKGEDLATQINTANSIDKAPIVEALSMDEARAQFKNELLAKERTFPGGYPR